MKPRRKKKGAIHKASGWRRAGQIIWKIPTSILIFSGRILKRHPRASLITTAVLVVGFLSWNLFSHLQQLQSHLLPTEITVESTDNLLRIRVFKVAKSSLAEAHSNHLSREAFLTNLQTRLLAIESLDGSTVRAGLDGRLQITASPHTPLFVLEAADGNSYLISKRMTLLGKALSDENRELPTIEAPDFKSGPKLSSAKENKGSKKATLALNLPWLHRTLVMVTTAVKTIDGGQLNFDRLVWRNASGFSVRFRRTTARPTPTTNSETVAGVPPALPATLTVLLGENDLAQKVEKMVQILKDLSAKNLSPESVDLNFPDKAIIRMHISDAGTTPSL